MIAVPSLLHEDARLRALHAYGVLDTPSEPAFDDLVTLAARICGTPIGVVALVDRDRLCFKARYGFERLTAPRDVTFCPHMLNQPAPLLLVNDTANDPRFADHPLVTGGPPIRFYAGVRLHSPEGFVVGTLCVVDYQPRTLDAGQQEGLLVLGRQVMAQLELRRSLNDAALHHARLANSQRIAGLGDWEYDFVGQRLLWSDEVYRIIGIGREEGPPHSETFYRQVHPEDLAFVQREKKIAAEGRGRVDFEHRIIRPDGTVRHVHQVAETVFDAEGKALRESGTIQDITERKLALRALRQSEERFKLAARAVSDAVWDWDLAADSLWWNEGFLTAFGFSAGDAEPGTASWTSRIHPEDRARVVDSIQTALVSGQESWMADYRFRHKGGHHKHVQDRGYILRNVAGEAIRMVGGMRDLTVQRKMEAQYLRAQRMDSIGTLAGGIAHDLNNVLAPIMMSIELLKLDANDREARTKILDLIQASCRRGADLVRQVLSFAKGLDGQRVNIGLRHLVNELDGVITGTFPRSIRNVFSIPGDLWPVTGDPSQIHQVLLNLAVNARDAMPQGGMLTVSAANVTLDADDVRTSPEAKTGNYVMLQVTDTGQGMPPEVRERIFEPFFTTKGLGKGTGIGLATVHTVIKSHGGFVTVDSELGRGTTFRIYLPAQRERPAVASAHPLPRDLPHGRNELVLVIDDDFAVRNITRQTLEAFGYRVITAADGAEAVAGYARDAQQISLVVTDMMMPIMDGVTTIQMLRRLNPGVRIIAASGVGSAENVANAAQSGVHDFLPKPYTAEILLQLVRRVIDRPAGLVVA